MISCCVGLTDELFTARTPCGVRPRDRDTGGAAGSANGSAQRSRLQRQRCLTGLRSDASAMSGVWLDCARVVVLLDLGLVKGYERGGYSAVTGDRASTSAAVSSLGAEMERGSSAALVERLRTERVAGITAFRVDCPACPVRPRQGRRDPDLRH